jgi:uncharacterized membrane protein (DUF2068 family)
MTVGHLHGHPLGTPSIGSYDRRIHREATVTRTVRRSTAHTAAAVLNAVLSLVGIVLSLPVLQQGADQTAAAGDQPPFAIIIVSLVLGTVGLVSSYGVWQGQRWGVVLTIVVNALSFLSGVPGIVFGPTTFLVVGSVIGCVANLLVIYLLLRRTAAPTTAGARI